MVTSPDGRTLFLREHREAAGISADLMAGKLGIERESVYRREREPGRLDFKKQAEWAVICGVSPEDLWRPPGEPSLDAIVRSASPETKLLAADIVRRLVESRE